MSRSLTSFALLALVLVFVWDARLADPWHFIGGLDVDLAHYWYKSYLRERLQAISLPLWAPQFFAGHPFLAYPEMCVFYPSSLLFVLMPLPVAFTLNYAIHLVIAGLGARAVAGLFTASNSASLLSGVCYAFSGYMLDRLHAGHLSYIQSAALLPWAFFYLDRAHASCAWPARAKSAVVFALLILASPPHNALYGLILMAVQTTAVMWRPAGRPRLGILMGTVFTVGLGLMLAAVQVLPTLEFARLTHRMDNTREFSTFMSFPPGTLAELLVPGLSAPFVAPLDEYGVDIGASGFALAVVSLLSRKAWADALAFPMAGAFSLTLMLGEHLPFYDWYLSIFPPLGWFRIPARAEVILSLSLAVLAGLAIDEVRQAGRRKVVLGGALALTGIGIVGVAAGGISAPLGRAFLFAAGVTGLLIASTSGKGKRLASLIPFLVFAELYLARKSQVPVSDARALEQTLHLERFSGSLGRPRVLIPFEAALDRGLRFGFEDVNGYAPIVVGRFYRLVVALSGAEHDSHRGHLLPPGAASAPHAFLAKLLNVQHVLLTDGRWFEFQESERLPRAWFVPSVTAVEDPEVQLRNLGSSSFDPAVLALVTRIPGLLAGTPLPDVPEGVPAKALIEIYEPERISVAVDTDRPRLLVFSEINYPGWVAAIDGVPAPILTTNYVFRGVPVPAGAKRVVLEFQPVSLALGGALSVGAIGFLALVLYHDARRRRGGVQFLGSA